LRNLYNQLVASVAIWEKFAAAENETAIRKLVPESAKNLAAIDEAWRTLPVGLAAVTHALVDGERTVDGRLAYLRLTRAEVSTVSKEIRSPSPKPVLGLGAAMPLKSPRRST
jgi:hypothetical protein